ncbi:MAG TPA: hypothetical protein VNK24_02000 [Elusimicrobiota bacterium]|nr:hypothetical protein [Elusimicrobiota bacterium]
MKNARPPAAGLSSAARVWLCGLAVALCFCSGYFLSAACRAAWQEHYPALAAQWPADGPFSLLGLYGAQTEEEVQYAARVQESANHFPAYDPYVLENRSRSLLLDDGLTYLLMGLVQKALGNMTWTWVAVRLVCCLFWFVLVYFIMLRLSGDEALAFFAGAFVVGFSYLLTMDFVPALQWTPSLGALAHDAWTLLSTGRTESVARLPRPGVDYSVLFLATLLEIKAAESADLRWGVAAGICGGLMPEIHPDIWFTHLPAMFFFLFLALFYKKLNFRNLAAAAGVCLLVSAPFLAQHLSSMWGHSAAKQEFLDRACVLFTRRPHWEGLLYVACFAAVVLSGVQDAAVLWLGAFLAAAGLVVNSQILTGKDVLFFQNRYYVNIYLLFLILPWLQKKLRLPRAFWKTAGALCLAACFLQSVSYAAIHYPFQGLRRRDAQAMAWLRTHTPEDSVVVALNPEVNLLVPVYTRDKVGFGSALEEVSDVPALTIARRVRAGLFNLGADQAKFYKDVTARYPDYGRRESDLREVPLETFLRTIYFAWIPRPMLARDWRLAGQDEKSYSYRVDYVWVDDFARRYLGPRFPRDSRWRLSKVYDAGGVALYKVGPAARARLKL